MTIRPTIPSGEARIEEYHKRLDLTWKADGKGVDGLDPFHSFREAHEAFTQANGLPLNEMPVELIVAQMRQASNAPRIGDASFGSTLFMSMHRYTMLRYDEIEEVEWRSIASSLSVHNFPAVKGEIVQVPINVSRHVTENDLTQNGIHAIWAMPNDIAQEYKMRQYKAVLDEVTNPVHYSGEAGNLSAGFLSRESLLSALRAMKRQTSLGHIMVVPKHLDMKALNLCNHPVAYNMQRKVLYWEESEGSKDWYLIAKPDADGDSVACATSPADDRPALTLERQGNGLTFKADGLIKVKMLNPRMFHRAAVP